MNVPTLILLGAAGGLLRGALDLYTRFVSWQADRHVHRLAITAGTAQGEAPRFQAYFDPPVDIAAAVVHTVMGSGAAVLFGTTGQISGEYAALVVGMSAPVLLTQLIRIQTVNEAVTGERQPAGVQEPAVEGGVASAAGTGGVGTPGTAAAVAWSAPGPGTEPRPAPFAHLVEPPPPTESPPRSARPMPSSRPPAAVADARTPEPAPGELPADRSRFPDPTRPGDSLFPADPADGTGSGLDGRSAPRWQRPGFGEEGL